MVANPADPPPSFCAATDHAPGAEQVAADLWGRWGASSRGYHDRVHLLEVLDRLTELSHDDPACILAAWFHDAVYTGTAGDDERASAALARELLPGLRLAGELVDQVSDLVLMTVDHEPSADPHQQALADADLAILAAPTSRYREYVAAVRRDFPQFDDATFAQGRADFIRGLLRREWLFHTGFGRQQWEEPARANLRAELSGSHHTPPA